MDQEKNSLIDWLNTLRTNSIRIQLKTVVKGRSEKSYFEIQKVEKCGIGKDVHHVVSLRSDKHQASTLVDLKNIQEILMEKPIEFEGLEVNKLTIESSSSIIRAERTIL